MLNISLEGWPKKRLEKAITCAESDPKTENWRFLFNLSAAYGCIDVAKYALEKSPELKRTVIADTSSQANSYRQAARKNGQIEKVVCRINSSAPFARRAWLKAWSAARGLNVADGDEPGSLIIESGMGIAELKKLFKEHPEVTFEAAGA